MGRRDRFAELTGAKSFDGTAAGTAKNPRKNSKVASIG
jgi:hypothetical protein